MSGTPTEIRTPWQWNRWGETTYKALEEIAKSGKTLHLPVLRNPETEAFFVCYQLARIPLVAPWQIPLTPPDGSTTPNIYGLHRRVRILHFKKEFTRPDGSKGKREFFLAEPAHVAGAGTGESHEIVDQVAGEGTYHLALQEKEGVAMFPGEYDTKARRTIKGELCKRNNRFFMRYHGMSLILDSPDEWKRAGAEELVGQQLLVSVWPAGKTSYIVKPFIGFHDLNPQDGIKYISSEAERTKKRAEGMVEATDVEGRKSWEAATTLFDLEPTAKPTLPELRKIYAHKRSVVQLKEETNEIIVINAALAVRAKEYMRMLQEAKEILEERITNGLSAFIEIQTSEDLELPSGNGVDDEDDSIIEKASSALDQAVYERENAAIAQEKSQQAAKSAASEWDDLKARAKALKISLVGRTKQELMDIVENAEKAALAGPQLLASHPSEALNLPPVTSSDASSTIKAGRKDPAAKKKVDKKPGKNK